MKAFHWWKPTRLQVSIFLLLLGAPVVGMAIVIGGSNLPLYGYPEPDCDRPIAPTKPYDLSDSWTIDRYNDEVQTFNMELERYNACVSEYLENASNDIQRIKEAAQDLIYEAERPY